QDCAMRIWRALPLWPSPAGGRRRAAPKNAIMEEARITRSPAPPRSKRDAHMPGAPIVAVTGGPTPQSRYKHAYQEVDDITQFDAVTKFNAQVDQVSRMPELIRQAFRLATSGAPGPVHLRMQGHLGQMTEQESDLDPLVEPAYRRVPAFRPEPEMQRIRDALLVLSEAERPMIVVGGGVMRSGAQRELVEIAEKLAIPVATSLNAKATLPDAHPLNAGV